MQRRIGVIPPTAVGGWLKSSLRRLRRSDLNDPPTAVGGIRGKEGRYLGRTLTIHRLPSVGFATIHCCIYFSKTIRSYLMGVLFRQALERVVEAFFAYRIFISIPVDVSRPSASIT